MATIRVKLRASSIAGKAGTVYYQVTHRRIVRQISTDIHILPEDWDGKQQCLKQQTSGQQTSGQPASSVALHSRIQGDMTLLRRIVRELDASGVPYTAEEIVRRFRKPEHTATILAFMQEQIDLLRQCNRLGTAQNYTNAMRRFARYADGVRPYVFPILNSENPEKTYAEYRTALTYYNRLVGPSGTCDGRAFRPFFRRKIFFAEKNFK